MKTKTAIHIAEEIWESSVGPDFIRILTFFGFDWSNPESMSNQSLMATRGPEMKQEIIAQWANLIMEHNHNEDTGNSLPSNGERNY